MTKTTGTPFNTHFGLITPLTLIASNEVVTAEDIVPAVAGLMPAIWLMKISSTDANTVALNTGFEYPFASAGGAMGGQGLPIPQHVGTIGGAINVTIAATSKVTIDAFYGYIVA